MGAREALRHWAPIAPYDKEQVHSAHPDNKYSSRIHCDCSLLLYGIGSSYSTTINEIADLQGRQKDPDETTKSGFAKGKNDLSSSRLIIDYLYIS